MTDPAQMAESVKITSRVTPMHHISKGFTLFRLLNFHGSKSRPCLMYERRQNKTKRIRLSKLGKRGYNMLSLGFERDEGKVSIHWGIEGQGNNTYIGA